MGVVTKEGSVVHCGRTEYLCVCVCGGGGVGVGVHAHVWEGGGGCYKLSQSILLSWQRSKIVHVQAVTCIYSTCTYVPKLSSTLQKLSTCIYMYVYVPRFAHNAFVMNALDWADTASHLQNYMYYRPIHLI